MSMTPEAIEGRLIAQRQLLARLVHAQGGDLRAYLRQKSSVEIPDEDPGADEISPAFAIEASLADEMRLILETVERLD